MRRELSCAVAHSARSGGTCVPWRRDAMRSWISCDKSSRKMAQVIVGVADPRPFVLCGGSRCSCWRSPSTSRRLRQRARGITLTWTHRSRSCMRDPNARSDRPRRPHRALMRSSVLVLRTPDGASSTGMPESSGCGRSVRDVRARCGVSDIDAFDGIAGEKLAAAAVLRLPGRRLMDVRALVARRCSGELPKRRG